MFEKQSDEAKIREVYKKLAPKMVTEAANFNIQLDYSIESLKSVDKILESLHMEYKNLHNKASQDVENSYRGYAEMLGCYMLAIIDKHKVPGKLTIVKDNFGTALGFTFASGTFSDFVAWCYKAILNGKDDAIVPKYELFANGKEHM